MLYAHFIISSPSFSSAGPIFTTAAITVIQQPEGCLLRPVLLSRTATKLYLLPVGRTLSPIVTNFAMARVLLYILALIWLSAKPQSFILGIAPADFQTLSFMPSRSFKEFHKLYHGFSWSYDDSPSRRFPQRSPFRTATLPGITSLLLTFGSTFSLMYSNAVSGEFYLLPRMSSTESPPASCFSV